MAIITKKCYAEMWTNSTGGADVLGPAGVVGARGGDRVTGADTNGMGGSG